MKIDDRFVQQLFGLCVALTFVGYSLPAMSICDSGDASGSGLHDSIITGTGSGGTGLRTPHETGTGTGGTGLGGEDDAGTGSGGTGIFGVVTGFGSVCVNGHEIEYDENTRIRQDGKVASISDLAVGQTVRIMTARLRPLVATHIDVERALAGPIDRIDPVSRRVWIMDQAVQLRRGGIVFDRISGMPTKLDQLRPGSYLAVSGLRRADGVISASRLDRQRASDQVVVTAVVRDLGQGTAYVGDTRTTFSSVDGIPSGSRDGRRLRVIGRWNAETRTLVATKLEDASTFDRQTRQISIQGFAAPSRSGADFRLAGTSVEVSHPDSYTLELNLDALVRIDGRIDDRGRLQADRITIDLPGHHGHPLRRLGDDTDHREKSDRGDRSGREDREEREDRSGRERTERPERTERTGRTERSGRSND